MSIDSYLNQDEDAMTSVNAVDMHSINCKEDLREKYLLCDYRWWRDRKTSWSWWWFWYWLTRVESKVKSSCLIYCRWYLNSLCKTLGDADLVSALNLVTRRLETLRIENVSQKKNFVTWFCVEYSNPRFLYLLDDSFSMEEIVLVAPPTSSDQVFW